MDAFFASVEQNDNPNYRNKPVIVGGSPGKRGVVAACSYEARKYGIHSAMSSKRAARLCPHAIFVKSRMHRYKEVSALIMKIFRSYSDTIEQLSVDEAFLDITDSLKKSSHTTYASCLAREIRKDILKTTGLTASAGISYNKFLAKVASDINKPNGQFTILPEDAPAFLDNLPIRKFYGVGKVTEKKMLELGIQTGKELRQWDRDSLVFHFGKAGIFLYNICRGIDERPVEPSRVRKSIGSEITLPEDTMDMTKIKNILTDITERIAAVLNNKKTGGFTLTLKIRYSDFSTISRSYTSSFPLYTTEDILHHLPRLLQATQAGNKKIRLLGLTISKLTGKKRVARQLPLPFLYPDKCQ